MPTASEASFAEAERWTRLAARWTEAEIREVWSDRAPRERDVVVFFDPAEDLVAKAKRSGYELSDPSLPSLARFAAALAAAEGDGWAQGQADVATRAYEQRRFLLGDRILHWAVPWLDAIGRCYPNQRDAAHADRDFLLEVADEMRVEPLVPGREGLVAEGEDAFGRIEVIDGIERWLTSLWSGHLMLEATWESLRSEGNDPSAGDIALLFEAAARRWQGVAERHPGSAQIWADLSARAARTTDVLVGGNGVRLND